MPWSADKPYDALPLLPPSIDLETKQVLKATIEARAALAKLDQAAQLLTNPAVLINAIPLLEAQASSEIENIVTTADELFRYAQSGSSVGTPATKEALRYRGALFEGVAAIRSKPLTVGTAKRVCSTIHGREMDIRKLPGTRIANPASGEIIYSPPEGAPVIADKLSNWEHFVHADDDLDPLIRMAVAHYQFEAIHPFHDGNGRTGRIVNVLMLIEAGLIDEPILYMSRYIIRHKREYYGLLTAVTSVEAWDPWVRYVLEAVRHTALSTVAKIAAIRDLQAEFRAAARPATPGGRNADFLAVLFEQPYCRISDVVKRCAVSRPTATGWLNDLVEHDLLVDRKVGRDRLFLNTRFLDVLVREESPQVG